MKKTKKTTIIAGAGATLAEALPSKPKKSLTPPLDATFFDLCRESGYQDQKTVRQYMQTQFGVNPFSGGYGMEEVFNYIYSDAFSNNPPDGCLDAYWALIGLYRTALANTTNPLKSNSRAGVGQLVRTLYEHDSSRILSIVTFNQDLVIEKALEHTKSLKKYQMIPWSIDQAYGFNFSRFAPVRKNSKPFTTGKPNSVLLLKMHGSLNWVYRVRSGTDPRNTLRKPSGKLSCVNDAHIRLKLSETVRGNKRSRQCDLIPIIVPPIYEKSARFQKVLDRVWSNAKRVLGETEELVVFGYSFPDADFAAKSLLRQCLHNNGNVRTLHIIDVNPAVAAKIVDIIRISSCHFYDSVECFREIYMSEN